MTLKQSGTWLDTMSFGSNSAGIPSFLSAISNACGPEKANRVKKRGLRQYSLIQSSYGFSDVDNELTEARVSTCENRSEATHQFVIVIHVIFGEGAEISGAR